MVVAVSVLGGVLCGQAYFEGLLQQRVEADPPGWQREASRVPYPLAALSGDLPPAPDRWNLDFYRALTSPAAPAHLALAVHLPAHGRLDIQMGAALLRLTRIGPPDSRLLTAAGQPLSCSAALPAPGDAPLALSLQRAGGSLHLSFDGGPPISCALADRRGNGILLRPGLRRVQVSDLVVDGQAIPPPGPHHPSLFWLVGGVLGGLLAALERFGGARPALVLLTSLPLLLAGFWAGRDFRTLIEVLRTPWLDPAFVALTIPLLLAGLLKGGHHLARYLQLRPGQGAPGPGAALLAALPLVFAPLSAQIIAPTAATLPLSLLYGLLLFLLAQGFFRLVYPPGARRGVLGGLLCASAAAVVFSAWVGISHPLGASLAGGAGLLGGLWLWVQANARLLRAYNLLSLALVVGGLVLGEGAVRYSRAGMAWSGGGSRTGQSDIYGWVDTANAEFQQMAAGRHTDYPDKGFPVAYASPSGRLRIVAMGGSTTGGAYQNDDLDEFYPARLDELLPPEVEVINQGVGGWTTWHIRAYLHDHIARLDPDILTLYVGHNDLLTPSALPYRELYAAWRQQGGAVRTLGRLLGGFRLYQGLRFSVVALAGPQQRVAVPLEDARDNLQAIVAAVTGRGGKVLLASEGLSPDPGPLADYFAMMAALAQGREDVRFVDTALALHQAQGAPLFLDDCHLTDAGHRLLAQHLREALQGWLPSRP